MAIKKILSSALVASLITVTMGSEIMAQTVTGPVQITTATSSIPSRHPTQFPLAKIIDGISANTTPFNGFAGQSQTVGKITFTFNGHYNLTAFRLWNGINRLTTGVDVYNLTFYRGSTVIGQRLKISANHGQPQSQMVTFPKMDDITSVEMEIISAHKITGGGLASVEIREVEFDGIWYCGGNPTTC